MKQIALLTQLTDSLAKIKLPESLRTLLDKIKNFSPQQKVEQLESFLASLSKKQRVLLSLSLFALGGSLLCYSVMDTLHSSKASLDKFKQIQASKAQIASGSTSGSISSDTIGSTNGFITRPSTGAITSPSKAFNQANESVPWREVSYMLASTPERRATVLEKLAFSQRESVILAISLTCPECIKLAVELNSNPQKEKLLAVAIGTDLEVKEWKEKLGISYEVKAISEDDMEDLGVALFPTLIKVSKTVNPKNPKSLKSHYEITATSDDGRVLANDSNNPQ